MMGTQFQEQHLVEEVHSGRWAGLQDVGLPREPGEEGWVESRTQEIEEELYFQPLFLELWLEEERQGQR